MAGLKTHNTTFYETLTPTLDTDAYTANDVLGGVQTMTLPSCCWWQLKIQDDAAQALGMRIWFFRADPNIADDAAMAPTDDELDDLAAIYTIADSDYITPSGGANAIVFAPSINIDLITPGLYYVYLETTGTPTYAANSLTLEFGFWDNLGG